MCGPRLELLLYMLVHCMRQISQFLTLLTRLPSPPSNVCWHNHAAESPCNMPASGLKLLAFLVIVTELGSLDKTAIAARRLQLEHSTQLACCASASQA